MELLAISDIAAEEFGAPHRARAGATFAASPDEAARLIEAGLAVASDSPDADFFRDARASLGGKRDG